jgi:hypothetical protein
MALPSALVVIHHFFYIKQVMRFRTLLSCSLAVVVGAIVGIAIKIGYALPGFLPTTDLFMFILESPLGKAALRARGGEAAVLITIVIRAFTCSVLAGVIAGAILRKIRFKRVLCYSALWVPIVDFVLGFLFLSTASVSNPEQVDIMQKNFGQVVWTDLWVYGWYFLALYASFSVVNHITLRSTGPGQKAAQAG